MDRQEQYTNTMKTLIARPSKNLNITVIVKQSLYLILMDITTLLKVVEGK